MKKVFILVFAFAVLSVGSIYAYNGSTHSRGDHSGYSSASEYGYNNGGRGNHNRGRNNDRGDGYNHNRGNHNGGCGYNY